MSHCPFTAKERRCRLSAVLALLLILVAAGPALASENQFESPPIPETIAGMELIELVDGEEAAAIIDRMHRGNVATRANFIARYQGQTGTATYYVSLYDDPLLAVGDMEEMAWIMGREGHGFSHLMRRSKAETPFYMALGQGQAHYFFARDLELIWLAADLSIAEQALEEILLTGN